MRCFRAFGVEGTTLFGTRSLEVRVESQPQVTLDQQPGSFYVGTLAALEHNVRHHVECRHTFDVAAVATKGEQTKPCLG